MEALRVIRKPSERNRLLDFARRFAADVFAGNGRHDLADLVLEGVGDDFPEVIAASRALATINEKLVRQEEALRFYADPSFWEDDLPGGALAHHDKGEVARNVLAKRRPFFHRD